MLKQTLKFFTRVRICEASKSMSSNY